MSLSINYSSGIGLHGVDPIGVSKDLIEWVSSYSDITVTGKTNFKNDINLLYDELNYLNISIDQFSNITLDITGNGQNGSLIINNRVNANNGINVNNGVVITGDTVIGEDSTDLMIVNSETKFTNNVEVSSNIITTSGNITTTNGDFTTTNGDFTTTNGDFTTTNGNIISHKFIYKNITGYENLYYWAGKNVISFSTEPFVGNNSFTRITYTPNNVYLYSGIWNGSYMFRLDNAQTDYRPPSGFTFTTSVNHMKISMPVKPGVSNSFFVKGITGDRWQSYVVYVNNQTDSGSYGYYRLEARTNSGKMSSNYDTYLTSSWVDPNGEGSVDSIGYHEWVMFYIPQYIIDEYCYSTTDDKSKYRKNINIYMIQGYGANSNENYISGLAMRENPLDIVINNALVLFWYLNGGNTGLTWNNDYYNHEGLVQIPNNADNILVPIPNKKNPSVYGYPNFILGYIEHINYNTFHGMRAEINMQSNINSSTLKNLGKLTRYNVGVFGLFLKERHKHPLGLIVPKLPYNSEFITIVQGRPYLRLKFTNITPATYTRGFYTELLDYTDNHKNMNIDGYEPVTYPS